MKEKIKLIIGEEFYDIGASIIATLIIAFGILTAIVWSLPFDF